MAPDAPEGERSNEGQERLPELAPLASILGKSPKKAGADKVRATVAKLERFRSDWPKTAEDLRARLLSDTKTAGFKAGETCTFTGNNVNFRKDGLELEGGGSVLKRFNRGATAVVADPVQRFENQGEVFVKVSAGGNDGWVAERFLKPVGERRDVVAKQRGQLDVQDAHMFREVVLHQLRNSEPKKSQAQVDVAYARWDKEFRHIQGGNLQGAAFDSAVQVAYRNLFGKDTDIFVDKVNMELELAAGATKAGTEIVVNNENPEDALNDALSQLGYEIGIFYGQGKMSVAQIKEAFGIHGLPRNGREPWGDSGSRVVFSYTDGNLYFYPPKDKAKYETVAVPGPRIGWQSERLGGGEMVMQEGERTTTRERFIGIRRPQNEKLELVRKQREKEYLAKRQELREKKEKAV